MQQVAKGTFSGPTKKKRVRELGPHQKQKKRKNRECELDGPEVAIFSWEIVLSSRKGKNKKERSLLLY